MTWVNMWLARLDTIRACKWLIMWHDMSQYVTWLMSHYVTWLIHTWQDLFRCSSMHNSLMTHVACDMTHSHVTWLIHMWHDLFTCNMTYYVTWRIMWHDSLTRDRNHWHMTWLIDTWQDSLTRDMTHWHVTWLIDTWHDSLTRDMTYVGVDRSIIRRFSLYIYIHI